MAEKQEYEKMTTAATIEYLQIWEELFCSFEEWKRLPWDKQLFPDKWEGAAYGNLYRMRRQLVGQYAWSVPTPEAVDAIAAVARDTGLISIGAGTGYWERLLADQGVEVVAFDLHPPDGTKHDYGHQATYFAVQKGSHREVLEHPEKTLFLSWPPYDDEMAYKAAVLSRCRFLVYVGERNGCTATERFENYLAMNFTELQRIAIPQFPAIHDYIRIFERITLPNAR